MKAAEPQTFRATTEAWIGQLLLPLPNSAPVP
jgi:hypothetical protein